MFILLFTLPMVMIVLGIFFLIQNKIRLQKQIGILWTSMGIVSLALSIYIFWFMEHKTRFVGLLFIQTIFLLLSIIPIQIQFFYQKRRKEKWKEKL